MKNCWFNAFKKWGKLFCQSDFKLVSKKIDKICIQEVFFKKNLRKVFESRPHLKKTLWNSSTSKNYCKTLQLRNSNFFKWLSIRLWFVFKICNNGFKRAEWKFNYEGNSVKVTLENSQHSPKKLKNSNNSKTLEIFSNQTIYTASHN